MESIDYEMAGYPTPQVEGETFVAFGNKVRKSERQITWKGDWTITGMVQPGEKCGEHLGLYGDGKNFTRTRRSCHRQECGICSWKWQAKAGDNASQYLQFIGGLGHELRHASFNPTAACTSVGGKITAMVDDKGHPVPSAPVGDMSAFKLREMRAFMEKYHDPSAGDLGGAYILHPGREEVRGGGTYYYSPHVHLITNFRFRKSDVEAMKQDCLVGGFTLTIFVNKRTSSYAIDFRDYKDDDGRIRNDLTAKLIYNFSHSLVQVGKTQNHAGITYFGSFRPQVNDYVKVKRKVLVRSKEARGMVKLKEAAPETIGDRTICRPIRKRGKLVPDLTEMGAYKWLRMWRFKYLPDPKLIRKRDRIVTASRKYRDSYEIAQMERDRWKTFGKKNHR